jgi:hypothetical protein
MPNDLKYKHGRNLAAYRRIATLALLTRNGTGEAKNGKTP